MKLCEDVELIFPEEEENVNSAQNTPAPQHYQPVINSPVNMSLLIQNIEEFSQTSISFHGEIAAISANGAICGAGVIEGFPPFGMAIWGDDMESKFENTLQPGEEITLVYWDENSDIEYPLESIDSKYNLLYEPDEILIASLKLVKAKTEVVSDLSINQVFPNPFNSTSNIEFATAQFGRIDFSLFDISGRTTIMKTSAEYTAGSHQIEIDGSGLSSGLYIASISANNRVLHTKIALIR